MKSLLYSSLALCLLTACAPKRERMLPSDVLHNLGCRITRNTGEPIRKIEPVADVNVDTVSSDPAAQTFEAAIHNNRRLGVRVRHVNIQLPRDRFNVVMTLDGKTHLRASHLDLDIYLETTIDGQAYALHCFPENPATGE